MDWESHLEINPNKKIEKAKIKVKFTHVNKKTPIEKVQFCSNTAFSLYIEIEVKKITPPNHSLFRFTSCFGVAKFTSPIQLQK